MKVEREISTPQPDRNNPQQYGKYRMVGYIEHEGVWLWGFASTLSMYKFIRVS